MKNFLTVLIALALSTLSAICQEKTILENETEIIFSSGIIIKKESGVRYNVQEPFLIADYYEGYSDGRDLFDHEEIFNSKGKLIIDHQEQLDVLCKSANGQNFALFGYGEVASRNIYLLNKDQEVVKKLEYGMLAKVKFSPDNQYLLILNVYGDDVLVYDMAGNRKLYLEYHKILKEYPIIYDFDISPRFKTLILKRYATDNTDYYIIRDSSFICKLRTIENLNFQINETEELAVGQSNGKAISINLNTCEIEK